MIYIQKDLDSMVAGESNISGLINDLVREHYKKVASKVEQLASVGIRSKIEYKTDLKAQKFTTTVVPDAKDVNKFKKRVERASAGFCKNGHAIPEGRSKCMGKGCKYA